MIYKIIAIIALFAGQAAAAPAPVDEVAATGAPANKEEEQRRELFPLFSVGAKHAKPHERGATRAASSPTMSLGDRMASNAKGPIKALEKLALNDDLNTVVSSGDMCTRRSAMARAAGLAAGRSLAAVNAPGFAAETKTVKMGSDNGQLVFVPDEVKICKGDSITWVNNKGGPHNVVFVEDAIPSGIEYT